MKIKYKDAKYLCKYDLSIEFFENLNLNIKDLWPTRNIYVLDTEEGKKILKMINYNKNKINYIVKMLNYVSKSYKNIISYHKFNDGNYFIDWKNDRYIILDLIEGIECNIYNPRDVFKVIRALALFHKSGKGITSQLTTMERKNSGLGNLENDFIKEKEEIYYYKSIVEKKSIKNEFDNIFLEKFDYYIDRINRAIELLKNSSYKELCDKEEAIALCHNDLAYHNILINEEEVYFIDFDFCDVNLKVLDLYNFLSKVLKRNGFDYDSYIDIVGNYRKNIDFSKEEEEILKVLLIYPRDFINIVSNYYRSKKDWSYESYLNKLKEKIAYAKENEILLKKL